MFYPLINICIVSCQKRVFHKNYVISQNKRMNDQVCSFDSIILSFRQWTLDIVSCKILIWLVENQQVFLIVSPVLPDHKVP